MAGTEADPPHAHWLLALVGIAMIAVAAVAMFKREDATLAGTFAFLGTVTVIIAVFEPRMEGRQQVSPAMLQLNLAARRAASAEKQVKAGSVVPLDEVVE